MINIVQQEIAEQSIWDALEVNQVKVAPRSKTVNNDESQSSNQVMPTLALNAEWAQVCEQFTDLTANVFDFLANMRIQCRPLRVCMFTICYLQNSIAVNLLVVTDTISGGFATSTPLSTPRTRANLFFHFF